MKPKDLKKWIALRQLQQNLEWLKKEVYPDNMQVISLPPIFKIVYLNLN